MSDPDDRKGVARRPSIQTVARACNLAPSTVSNALRGKPYVRPETRARVLQAAEELGYRASTLARALRLNRSWSIGLVVANISNPFYPELVKGAEDAAARAGYNLIVCNTDYRADKQTQYIEVLLDRRIDGLILAAHPGEEHIRHLAKLELPHVLLNKGLGPVAGDYVGIDNVGGAWLAVDYLHSLGHRAIGYIGGHESSGAAAEREMGFGAARAAHDCKINPSWVGCGNYRYEDAFIAASAILETEADRPTAIFAASDLMALGVMDAARKLGLRVAEDLSVVGFDDIFISRLGAIDLTTVHVDKPTLGETATARLIERIEGDTRSSFSEVILPVELRVRRTCAPPREPASAA